MTSSKLKGYVMVFPTSLIEELGQFQGLNFEYQKYINAIISEYKFIYRFIAEKDTNYKQVIPYVILYHSGSIFSYRRGKLLSEDRLLGNYSIGIGGHISIEDDKLFDSFYSYEEAMIREIREEVYIDTEYENRIVAVLNDDSNEVGKVHFGIIHLLDLQKPRVKKKEKSINEPMFREIPDLLNDINIYENWSKICIKNIEKIFSSPIDIKA